MNQLSSHKNYDVLETLSEAGITVLHLPPKGSIPLSSLDNGFFRVFKRKLQLEIEMHSGDITSLHFKTALKAYYSVSAVTLVNFFNKCELIGNKSLSAIQKCFRDQCQSIADDKNRQYLEKYQK